LPGTLLGHCQIDGEEHKPAEFGQIPAAAGRPVRFRPWLSVVPLSQSDASLFNLRYACPMISNPVNSEICPISPGSHDAMIDHVPFFIVGSGRSGTTLLRLILAGHSRIHIPPETWFILPLVERFSLSRNLTPEEVSDALKIITSHRRWADMGISEVDFARWAGRCEHPKLVDLINLIYRAHLERSGKVRFGDKTPPYINIVPELSALYPGAKFIHLIRDGRDVTISFVDANLGHSYDGKGFEWKRAIRLGLAYRNSPYAGQILEIRYEDMVADLEGTIRKICTFLGERFEPQMLEYRDRTDLVPTREQRIHSKLGQPISVGAIAAWRTRLSALECFCVEANLHGELLKLGYPLRFSSAVWRPLFVVSALLLRGLAPFMDRALPALRRRNLLPRKVYI
jgi:hypothetical protein